jgi:16S rRNA (cytosine967-C5)-methyltransferase
VTAEQPQQQAEHPPTHPPPSPALARATRVATHVVPLGVLANAAVAIALEMERVVFVEKRPTDRALAESMRAHRHLSAPDRRFLAQAVAALFRWRGWIEPLRRQRPEERLLLAVLLDAPQVHPVCRHWARVLGWDPAHLVALGDAPTWHARAAGLRRLLGGQAVTADPWRLFPDWLRDHLPLPPGTGPAKARFMQFLRALQARPMLWARAQGEEESAVWAELTAQGIKPWVHRRMTRAARFDPSVDLHHTPPVQRGALIIQDLAAQAVGLVCDPDPGERWWVAGAGTGGSALHLASLMKGKGVVVATDTDEPKLREVARRARRGHRHNLTTKLWDARHVVGKPGRYDGVLIEAPSSAIGTWRRHPEARWLVHGEAIAACAARQGELLRVVAPGVRPGGALVYAVATVTLDETRHVVQAFLAAYPEFQLDPFPHPLRGDPTDGTLFLWPQEADSEAMFLARMIRSGASPAATGGR